MSARAPWLMWVRVVRLQEAFLAELERLQPSLCVTAAYGNMLPRRFLATPKHCTLNIHPSLLPLYRGAAPVNRCLQAGDSETGVSLAFTVLACDAGPVLAQRRVPLDGDEQTPELLQRLFSEGAEMLVEALPRVWTAAAAAEAAAQDDAAATAAPKMAKGDAELDFSQPAETLHNKVSPSCALQGQVCWHVLHLQLGDRVCRCAALRAGPARRRLFALWSQARRTRSSP